MLNLLYVFVEFFKSLERRSQLLFFIGVTVSVCAGASEAMLFNLLDVALAGNVGSQLTGFVVLLIILRFVFVYVSCYVISQGSAQVTGFLMTYFSIQGEYDAASKNTVPKAIAESERIGMGYYLAGQTFVSNLVQLLALLVAAALITSREFLVVSLFLIPMYFLFSFSTSKAVRGHGKVRMNGVRLLSSSLSAVNERSRADTDYIISSLSLSIFKVRLWSLIQKPTLELIGIASVLAAIAVDSFLVGGDISAHFISYVVLSGIFIRLLPYANQMQNSIALASSIHHEVSSFIDEHG